MVCCCILIHVVLSRILYIVFSRMFYKFLPKSHIIFSVQKFTKKTVSGETIWFDPCCPFKNLIEISPKIFCFVFGVQAFTKKLHLGHYSLTHIVFPRTLHKIHKFSYFLVHIFFYFQKFIQKIVSGTIWFHPYSFQGSYINVHLMLNYFWC